MNVNGIEIEVQRKKIKNLHLHVRPDGSVYVSVPKRVPEREAVRFVRSNIGWIEAQRKKYKGQPGREYYKTQKPAFDEKAGELLRKWEQLTGLSCKSWHSRYMTSRWGSCIPAKGRLCFNLALADKPEICLEYVILHELLHLKYPGHGADFKRELTRYMPQWRSVVKQLG